MCDLKKTVVTLVKQKSKSIGRYSISLAQSCCYDQCNYAWYFSLKAPCHKGYIPVASLRRIKIKEKFCMRECRTL